MFFFSNDSISRPFPMLERKVRGLNTIFFLAEVIPIPDGLREMLVVTFLLFRMEAIHSDQKCSKNENVRLEDFVQF